MRTVNDLIKFLTSMPEECKEHGVAIVYDGFISDMNIFIAEETVYFSDRPMTPDYTDATVLWCSKVRS